jgi:hypothetical protein
MSYTLTYYINAFPGERGTVPEVQPTSLNIDGSLHIPGENTVTPNGPTGISVSQQGQGVTLNIKICGSGKSPYTYYPVGLAIQPQSGDKRPATGVFPTARVSEDGSTIVLADFAQLPDAAGYYEFVVLFQVSTGNFAWLDPMITNDGP